MFQGLEKPPLAPAPLLGSLAGSWKPQPPAVAPSGEARSLIECFQVPSPLLYNRGGQGLSGRPRDPLLVLLVSKSRPLRSGLSSDF